MQEGTMLQKTPKRLIVMADNIIFLFVGSIFFDSPMAQYNFLLFNWVSLKIYSPPKIFTQV